MKAEVTADLFSGRPNPSWVLDDDRSRQLLLKLKVLRVLQGPLPLEDSGLGYRGLSLRLYGNGEEEIFVKGGVISFRGEFLDDAGRRVERWVIDQAPAALDFKTGGFQPRNQM